MRALAHDRQLRREAFWNQAAENGRSPGNRLAGLRPKDPFVHYNLACSYSNLSDLDGAFDALGRAFDLGYRDYPHLLKDPDLEKVRQDRRFKQLLNKKWGKRQP